MASSRSSGLGCAFRAAVLLSLGACAREARSEELRELQVVRSLFHRRDEPAPLSGPVARSARSDLEFELTLTHLPHEVTIPLHCEWRSADGALRHRNAWHTRAISHEPWPTHCRYRPHEGDPAGSWSVTMTQAGRELGSASFVVE